MSRIIPKDKKSLDRALWEAISGAGATGININTLYPEIPDHWYWLGNKDKGRGVHHSTSDKSQLFTPSGREQYDGNTTMVIDFIGLPTSMISWFQYISSNTNQAVLLTELTQRISTLPTELKQGGVDLPNGGTLAVDDSWLELNWEVLGRILGSAIIQYGKQHGMWSKQQGKATTNSMQFWSELSDYAFTQKEWDELIQGSRDRNIDPSIEIIRAIGHQVSAPFFINADLDGDGSNTYSANPLALYHRMKMQEILSTISTENLFETQWNDKDSREEYVVTLKNGERRTFKDQSKASRMALSERSWRKIYGELVIKTFGHYLDELANGNVAEFVMGMHGMCAFHLDRSDEVQMKIGMQLFSNLAAGKTLRNVEMINVPDLAQDLASSLPLSQILKILWMHGIIRWVTIEKGFVDSAKATLGI